MLSAPVPDRAASLNTSTARLIPLPPCARIPPAWSNTALRKSGFMSHSAASSPTPVFSLNNNTVARRELKSLVARGGNVYSSPVRNNPPPLAPARQRRSTLTVGNAAYSVSVYAMISCFGKAQMRTPLRARHLFACGSTRSLAHHRSLSSSR